MIRTCLFGNSSRTHVGKTPGPLAENPGFTLPSSSTGANPRYGLLMFGITH